MFKQVKEACAIIQPTLCLITHGAALENDDWKKER